MILRGIGWRVTGHICHEVTPIHPVLAHVKEHEDCVGAVML